METEPPNDSSARAVAISAEVFIQTLQRSRLLTRSRLDAALAERPSGAASARQLAEHLISRGDLTHYQAEKLLQGLWQGLVLGPYQVLAPLGRGGMGTVYLARDMRGPGEVNPDEQSRTPTTLGSPLNSPIAIKVLPPKRAREEAKTLLRFRREMELGRRLDHPNITKMFDSGEINGVYYIAMEYVPGQSLRQVVAKGGPLLIADAASAFADVAAGLAHAHAQGLIHRDLKPSNIMITPTGRAKILDLGLAMVLGETLPEDPSIIGGQGYILGTMDYIAPEQAADSTAVGPRSDLYALGCSIYYAVTGAPPFPGGTAQQKIKWHRTEEPPEAAALNRRVPAGFSRLIEHLMAKRPDDRPPTAEAARALLLPWAGDTVTRAIGLPAPHSAAEVVAEIDSRAFDPSLWDVVPYPVDEEPAANGSKPAAKQNREAISAERVFPIANRTSIKMVVLAAAIIACGLVALAVLFSLLRRL